ncbi:MAG: hypothetical protein NTZ48_04135 [Candidatus Omnitrophica bacterium]|nr:hypothetical protein [Candidatus Omnitrophota bacterium]
MKNNRLYAFPLDFLSWDQPNSRWSLGMTWSASKIQPKLFADVNMTDEVTNFYKTLYNLDAQTITDKILPLIRGD